MYQERWYQNECANAVIKDVLDSEEEIHPVAVVPTGGGKTVVMCKIIDAILTRHPTSNVLVLVDDERITGQNHQTLENFFEIDIGLCHAGLGEYDIRKITMAGIHSVYRKARDFQRFDYIIIDECHTINVKEAGMYRKFLAKVGKTYMGLTATPWRTGHGYIHIGETALFNKISYNMLDLDIYNRIVAEGFLKPLFSYPTAVKFTGEGCRTTAGDWNEKDLSEKNDTEAKTKAAVKEVLYYGKKYKHWLGFAIDTKHCDNIVEELKKQGINAVAIHSKSETFKEDIRKFKQGKYRAAVHVNMLTKGFDFPDIDLIFDFRPTKSPIVHVQGKGRGGRPVYAEGYDLETIDGRLKAIENSSAPHCLVLDFAGNVERLGPINNVKIKQKGEKGGSGDAVTKRCPECKFLTYGAARFCDNCGHEFEFKNELNIKASSLNIVAESNKKEKLEYFEPGQKIWANVDNMNYQYIKPFKADKNPYVKVIYRCGINIINEHIYLDHPGKAKARAIHWVKYRWLGEQGDFPKTSIELYYKKDYLKKPKMIYLDCSKSRVSVIDSRF